MVTREEAVARMAKMACFQETPCVPCVEDAEPYLDALLDYLEEQSYVPFTAGLIADLRGEVEE